MDEEEELPPIELSISDIILMRIYDVLMSEFALDRPEDAEKLYDLHERGGLLMPAVDYDPKQIITRSNDGTE